MAGKRFADRRTAGRELAALMGEVVAGDVVVIAIPRGGIEVGAEVAAALGAPFDVAEVHEIRGHAPQIGLGVVTPDGERNVRRSTAGAVGVGGVELADRLIEERAALREVVAAVRVVRPPVPVAGRSVIIVDDTLSNLSETVAAAEAVRDAGARRVILAVAVAASHFGDDVQDGLDGLVSVERGDDVVRAEDWFDDLGVPETAEVVAIVTRHDGR